MPAFLKDITPFIGTGEKNEDGLTLEEFLDQYNPLDYENPCVTADILVFRHWGPPKTVTDGLKLLLIKRRNHPGIGYWALPGGFNNIREDIEAGAKRELMEETGLSHVPMEQLYTYGEVSRDPRARVITTAYLALVEDGIAPIQAGDDAKDAAWFSLHFEKTESHINDQGDRQRIETLYTIYLNNEEKGLSLSSKVLVSENVSGILREPSYKVIDQKGLAFDHPRFIVQALLYLEERILKQP